MGAEVYVPDAADGDVETGEHNQQSLSLTPDAVEVRRNAGLAAAVGAVAAGLAIAYLARAVAGSGVVDALLAASMGLLAAYWLLAFLDARTPLLVADAQGVRIRLGHTWRGLPWSAVKQLELTPRRGLLHDGRMVITAHNEEKLLAELDGRGRLMAAWSTRWHGGPFALPLGLATRVVGADDDLGSALERVSQQSGAVTVIDPRALEGTVPEPTTEPAPPADIELDTPAHLDEGDEPDAVVDSGETRSASWRDPRPLLAVAIARLSPLSPLRRARNDDRANDGRDGVDEGLPVADLHTEEVEPAPRAASATPAPLRESTAGRRSEVRRDLPEDRATDQDELRGRELRRAGSVSLVEDTEVWGDRVRPISRGGDVVEAIVLDDFEVEPATDPVIGPELVAARTRLGLSVDQVADRTRIRPHVIESIEVDDFAPCGGDFYARGHLRTLARILGVDVTPMLAAYDERYAHADINPRRVFEAELSTGANGSIRSTRGGPNWSLLVAVVMAVVLCWSVARLVMDAPSELVGSTPVLNGSGGPGGPAADLGEPVPVVVSAASGGAHIVVRDGAGKIVFKGNLAAGDVKEIVAAPPVRVQTTDGAVTVALDGQDAKPVGEPGVATQGTYVPR